MIDNKIIHAVKSSSTSRRTRSLPQLKLRVIQEKNVIIIHGAQSFQQQLRCFPPSTGCRSTLLSEKQHAVCFISSHFIGCLLASASLFAGQSARWCRNRPHAVHGGLHRFTCTIFNVVELYATAGRVLALVCLCRLF